MVCILPYFAWGGGKREHVLVLECDKTPFRRATYINQARVHQGYHYPRSISTAMKSCEKLSGIRMLMLFAWRMENKISQGLY